MELNSLKPRKGARKNSVVRLGRGESSGHGKTSGKGGKGQTARTGGKVRAGFEGGQMPLYRRLPKLGFRSGKKTLGLNQYTLVNLTNLNKLANDTTVDFAADKETIKQLGVSYSSKDKAGVKILANGELERKLHLKVHACSEAARKKIEALGGSVVVIERAQNKTSERQQASKKAKKK